MVALRRGKRGELAEDLNCWLKRTVCDLGLKIPPPPVLLGRVDGFAGYYRWGSGLFGFWDEIIVDEEYVAEVGDHSVLSLVVHEALHGWQYHHGTPPSNNLVRFYNHHNAEYIDKARSLGLIVDCSGCTSCEAGHTPFLSLLREHGVHVPRRLRVRDRSREQSVPVKTAGSKSRPVLTNDTLLAINEILASAGFKPLQLPDQPRTPPPKLSLSSIENLLKSRTSLARSIDDLFRRCSAMPTGATKHWSSGATGKEAAGTVKPRQRTRLV